MNPKLSDLLPFDPEKYEIQELSDPQSIQYMLEKLDEYFPLANLVNTQVRRLPGTLFTLVPKGTPVERARQLHRGGKWLVVGEEHPRTVNPVEDHFIIPYIAHFLSQSPLNVLFCEDPYSFTVPGRVRETLYNDGVLQTYYQEQFYCIVSSILGVNDLKSAIREARDEADGFLMSLTLSQLDVRPILERKGVLSAGLETVAQNIHATMVPAYDDDGWVMWRRN